MEVGSVDTIILNVVVSIGFFASYWVGLMSTKSPFFQLNKIYFSSEGWSADNGATWKSIVNLSNNAGGSFLDFVFS